MADRYVRQEAFFGEGVQQRLAETRAAIVGVGGTGSHIAQQLAYLGVGQFDLLDDDRLDETNLNRVVTALPSDAAERRLKVDVAKRCIEAVNPAASVRTHEAGLFSSASFALLRTADIVFSCVDRELPRFVLNELCQAYEVPLLDLATEIDEQDPRSFGGRVVFALDNEVCIYCCGEIDQDELRRELATDAQRLEEARVYGVPQGELGNSGPSVVMLNGLIASAAVTEFIMAWSGLRKPCRHLRYNGRFGVLSLVSDAPSAKCPYCRPGGIRGQRDDANLERWLSVVPRSSQPG